MGQLIYFLFWFPLGSSLFGLIFRFALASLVFTDRHMNGKNPFWWTLFTFFFGIWGFILYMVFGSDTIKTSAARARRQRVVESVTKSREIFNVRQSETVGLSKPPFEDPVGDDSYVDHYIEELLEGGETDKARSNVEKILQVASELGDEGTIQKYAGYKKRLIEEKVESKGERKEDNWLSSSDRNGAAP